MGGTPRFIVLESANITDPTFIRYGEAKSMQEVQLTRTAVIRKRYLDRPRGAVIATMHRLNVQKQSRARSGNNPNKHVPENKEFSLLEKKGRRMKLAG